MFPMYSAPFEFKSEVHLTINNKDTVLNQTKTFYLPVSSSTTYKKIVQVMEEKIIALCIPRKKSIKTKCLNFYNLAVVKGNNRIDLIKDTKLKEYGIKPPFHFEVFVNGVIIAEDEIFFESRRTVCGI